jgi:two-component sensor histidine kinase
MTDSSVLQEKVDRMRALRHTIKNDISVIIAFSQLVKVNPSDEKAQDFLDKIEARAKLILTNIEKYIAEEPAE